MPEAPDLIPPAGPESILARLEGLGIRLGLDNSRRLLALLGDPQARVPAVTIAGSNGKGSTAALLAAMLSEAGYAAGLYTSPHLETVEERLRISGRAISSAALADLLGRVVECSEGETGSPPTYFEALTLAAFLWFAEQPADVAVLEVGLGGRLDTTNLADPLLSVITSISLEHQEYLGDSLAAITREKAGVFRRGRPALVWLEEEEPAAAARQVAAEVGAELRFVHREVAILGVEPLGRRGQRVRLATPVRSYELEISLPGRHQASNLALAVRAAEILAENGFGRLGPDAIAAGARRCRWPGRLEEVTLPDGRRCLLDAAHNAEGAAALAGFLAEEAEPVDILFGVLVDKDAREMLASLAPRARRFVFTAPASPRARPPAELGEILPASFRGEIEAVAQPREALLRALAGASRMLVVCGSIFLVGEIRRYLREEFGVPPPPQGFAAPQASGQRQVSGS